MSARSPRMPIAVGITLALIVAIAAWTRFQYIALYGGRASWTSTVVPVALLGGIQLLCTGIIGQYLAKDYLETKRRPRFLVEKKTNAP